MNFTRRLFLKAAVVAVGACTTGIGLKETAFARNANKLLTTDQIAKKAILLFRESLIFGELSAINRLEDREFHDSTERWDKGVRIRRPVVFHVPKS